MTIMTEGERPRDTLPLRLVIMRTERGVSQREAALMCGLTYGEWQSIEAGRKAGSLDQKVTRIAKGLRYDRDWIMWGGPLAPNPPDGGGAEHPNPRSTAYKSHGLRSRSLRVVEAEAA